MRALLLKYDHTMLYIAHAAVTRVQGASIRARASLWIQVNVVFLEKEGDGSIECASGAAAEFIDLNTVKTQVRYYYI